jgi:cation:H+ antiporter
MAVRQSQGVAIGTLIGSNITDPLLSIGSAAIISPLTITSGGVDMFIWLIIPYTIFSTAIALVLMRTSYVFKRWEGILLISLYFVFLALCEYFRRFGF